MDPVDAELEPASKGLDRAAPGHEPQRRGAEPDRAEPHAGAPDLPAQHSVRHGVGFLAWESIAKNDFPVVQAVVLVLSIIYICLTMLADILNAILDPRIRAA